MYVRVYAPNGEPFDVTRECADRLILQEGWTQKPVSDQKNFNWKVGVNPVENFPKENAAIRTLRGRKNTRRVSSVE